MSFKKYKAGYILGAAILPVLLMLIIYAIIGIYPFGEKSVLTIDLNNQYISYYSYLREILKGNHSFLYTFSKTLGGDMVGLSAYYLFSPFNLVLLLFPTEALPTAVEIITLLKLACCGASFYFCISRLETEGPSGKSPLHSATALNGEAKAWQGWLFSTAYALMSYNILYQQNLMWLDGVILLPLIILGIHRIFCGKAPFLYMASLFLAIITNYYIGFMLCLFSVLYFLFLLFSEAGRKKQGTWKIIRSYSLASALSGGLCMWLLIPVLKSLSGGKAAFDMSLFTLQPNFFWNDFLVKFLAGSFDKEQIKFGLPNVYCGIISLFFLGLFFLNRRIASRKKAGVLALLAALFLSFYINGINLIWHGFNAPAWFPYRYSFVFSFVVLLFAWNGFQRAKDLSARTIIFMSCAIAFIGTLVVLYMSRKPFSFMTKEKCLFNIIILITAVLLFTLYFRQKTLVLWTGIFLLAGVELCTNGVFSLQELTYRPYDDFKAFVESAEPAADYVKALDKGFYRMEKTFVSKECDPMLLDYNGLSHYSSSEKTVVKYFMGQSGFRNNGSWAYYNRGSTFAMDSLLGVKYILSKVPMEEPYQLLDTIGEVGIYQNSAVLPMGFMADGNILSCEIDDPHKFRLQNNIWRSLYPENGKDIFYEEHVEDVTLHNLKNESENSSYYTKENPKKEAYIEYTLKASSDYPIFGYLGTEEMHNVQISVNKKNLGRYFNTYQYDIMRLGSFKKGEKITIRVKLKDTKVNITDVWFYHQDMNIFAEYLEPLSSEAFRPETFSDTRLVGTVTSLSGRERLFLSIPNETGWHAYIDGSPSEILSGAGIFMTLEIPEGTHQIELRYIPAGIKEGRIISLLSLAVLGGWIFLRVYPARRKTSCA